MGYHQERDRELSAIRLRSEPLAKLLESRTRTRTPLNVGTLIEVRKALERADESKVAGELASLIHAALRNGVLDENNLAAHLPELHQTLTAARGFYTNAEAVRQWAHDLSKSLAPRAAPRESLRPREPVVRRPEHLRHLLAHARARFEGRSGARRAAASERAPPGG